ncbi:MAG: radical SAM protein [archaeon]
MRVMLALCPVWHTKTPPLGIAYLSAFLRARGHQVRTLDLNIDLYRKTRDKYGDKCRDKSGDKTIDSAGPADWWDFTIPEAERISRLNHEEFCSDGFLDSEINGWVRRIAEFNPDVLGLSAYAESREFSLELAQRVKAEAPKVRIVFGGPLCRASISDSEWFAHERQLDAMVIGEGELTCQALLEMWEKGRGGELPGAITRTNGKIAAGGLRDPLPDLDINLPFPDYCDFPLEEYTKRNMILIQGSRGCVGSCGFCHDRVAGKRYRCRSPGNIFTEMLLRIGQGYDSFEFCDLVLNADVKRLEKLCELIIDKNLGIHWGGPIRCSPGMTLGVFKKMSMAGAGRVNIGMESGCQKMLDSMRKGFRIRDMEQNLRDMHDAGIDSSVNILIGYPGETNETVAETMGFIRRNRRHIKHVSSLTPMYLMPGTYAAEHTADYGISPGGDLNSWSCEQNTHKWRIEQCMKVYNLINRLGIGHECSQFRKDIKSLG